MKLYSTAEAAAYLGYSVAAVKWHIYVKRDLVPDLRGKSLAFTQETLDRFRATRPKRQHGKEVKIDA